jgi:glycerol-3-phosphate dehydrogenase
MAEQTVDELVRWLKKLNELNQLNGSKLEILPCRTADESLLPAAEVNGHSGILPPEFSRRAVEHFCANEWAAHLDDVMVRRTSWHYYFKDANQKAAQVAEWMGEILGWSTVERAEEIARYRRMTGCQSAPNPATSPQPTRRNEQQPVSAA